MKLRELLDKEKFILFHESIEAVWHGESITVKPIDIIFQKIIGSEKYNVLLIKGQNSSLTATTANVKGGGKVNGKITKLFLPLATQVIRVG